MKNTEEEKENMLTEKSKLYANLYIDLNLRSPLQSKKTLRGYKR
jgi:hypothetical protein